MIIDLSDEGVTRSRVQIAGAHEKTVVDLITDSAGSVGNDLAPMVALAVSNLALCQRVADLTERLEAALDKDR